MPKKTQDELRTHLQEQMGFLHRSADSYDTGIHNEALRLAVTLRVLLYDTPRCSSLLAQLRVKHDLLFANTGSMPTPRPGGTMVGAFLAPLRMGPGRAPEHIPMLHEATRGLDQTFYHWWRAPVIGTSRGIFTREDAILALANKEGGAHVDPKVDQKLADLRTLGIGVVFHDEEGQVVDQRNPALPTVRQIAFEVEVTVHGQLGDLLTPRR